jgi:polyribonucleotide nucleotidyltransferase
LQFEIDQDDIAAFVGSKFTKAKALGEELGVQIDVSREGICSVWGPEENLPPAKERIFKDLGIVEVRHHSCLFGPETQEIKLW